MTLKGLGAVALVLICCASLRAGFAPAPALQDLRFAMRWPDMAAPQTPHPAVVRVIAPERGAMSLGSGTLVDKNGEYGLVITNWHVVRDARGPVEVVFPDGFRSHGTVVRMDRDWDLAVILIWKPPAEPVPLSPAAPRPGEVLSIAGYGSGSYRMQTGRCTQYLAPGANKPFEMVEMSAAARQGDSGGPIFNHRGELAGVLFGAGDGRTSGSYSGRVHQFLQLAAIDLQRLPTTNIAARDEPVSGRAGAIAAMVGPPESAAASNAARFAGGIIPPDQNPDSIADRLPHAWQEHAGPKIASHPAPDPMPPVAIAAAPSENTTAAPTNRPSTNPPGHWFLWGQELKSILAAFGVAAIVLQVLRWIAARKN